MDIKTSNGAEGQMVNEWYLFRDCAKFGPLTAKEITEMLDRNQINKDHHVWHQTYNNWVAIKDVDAFKTVGFEVQLNQANQNFIEDGKNPQVANPKTKSSGQKARSNFDESSLNESGGFFKKILSYFKS